MYKFNNVRCNNKSLKVDLSLINPLSVTAASQYNNVQGLQFRVATFYEILGFS